MLTYNDQTKARFPLSLDGRGARGVFVALLLGCMALLAAPQAVLAQVNPGCTGANPGAIDCPYGDYSGTNGISHTSNGDLHINFDIGESDGDSSTTPNTTNVSNYETGGTVTTAGNLNDNLSLFVTGNYNNNAFFQDFPVLFDVESQAGNIDLEFDPDVEDFDIGVGGTATHFARLISTDGGTVRFTGGGADGEMGINAPVVGIEARSLGGDGDVIVDFAGSHLQGGDYGILAEAQGSGDIIISTGSAIGSVEGIDATAETGDIHITGGGISSLRTETAGLATIETGVGSLTSVGNRVVVNVSGPPLPSNDLPDDLRKLPGSFDFSGLTGGAELNMVENAGWILDPQATGQYVFSPVGDTVNAASSAITLMPIENFSGSNSAIDPTPAVVDFGAGNDSFNNAGTILVAPVHRGSSGFQDTTQNRTHGGEMRLENLETFEHAGTIFLGANFSAARNGQSGRPGGELGIPSLHGTDNWNDDILVLPDGTHWIGMDGLIVLDAQLNSTAADGQSGCDASLRQVDPDRPAGHPGDMPSADCVDLRDGAASGRTLIEVVQISAGDRGAYNPDGFVLVDLSGGDPAEIDPDAFGISPTSQQYSPKSGGIIDKGLFAYSIGYDADTQQFKLYGVAAAGAQQFPLLSQAANELWRTSTDSWFSRQADQRDVDVGAGLGGGAWGRVVSNSAERDLVATHDLGTRTATFDNSYNQDNVALTFGLDMVSRSEGDRAWVFGAMVGYAQADVDFDDYANTGDLEGTHAGLYGSYTMGAFFLDAALNGAWLELDNDMPAMGLTPEGTVLNTNLSSLGGQVETGWRMAFGSLGVEPLASLSYVKTSFENLNVPADDTTRIGGDVEIDGKSLRGGLGVRLSMEDVLPGIVPTGVSLTARAIEEFDGEANATIVNTGPLDAQVTDTFDGTFSEIVGSVSVSNTSKTAVGYLNVNGLFGDDYESVGFETGFRYQW